MIMSSSVFISLASVTALLAAVTPVLSATSSSYLYSNATITSAAVLPSTTAGIPLNTCTRLSSGVIVYTPCWIGADIMHLTYWPTDNRTYPSTYYDKSLSYTFLSPSVYMVIKTVSAWNSCGQVGPIVTDAILEFDLSELSTLQNYANAAATTRLGEPQQLQLSDLYAPECTKSVDESFLATQTHPVENALNRCNPSFVFHVEMKRVGYPYYAHCNNYRIAYGLADPPVPIPTAGDLIATTASAQPTAIPAIETTGTTMAPTTGATAEPDLASSTSTPVAETPTTTPQADAKPITAVEDNISTMPSSKSQVVNNQQSASASVVVTIGTQVFVFSPSASVVVVGSQTASVGGPAVTDSNSIIVSLGASGLVINTAGGARTTFSTPPMPTPATATVQSTAVYGGETLTIGGDVKTISSLSAVVSLGSSGIIVQYPSGVVSAVKASSSSSGSKSSVAVNGNSTAAGSTATSKPAVVTTSSGMVSSGVGVLFSVVVGSFVCMILR